MVSQHPEPPMQMRLNPPRPPRMPTSVAAGVPLPEMFTAPAAPPPWRFEVKASDGTVLMAMFERDGRLAVEGDESRWDEAARRFVHTVMQWSGQAGIRWKDDARKAGETA